MIADQKSETGQIQGEQGSESAIAEFIRTRGVTRCPTACVSPTQGAVTPPDRAALNAYAESRDRVRRARAARKVGFMPLFDIQRAR
ncbi:MAG TPA: hypothetical protein VGI28_12320 [Stellaceae bacterium]